jgi:hypothetical protein
MIDYSALWDELQKIAFEIPEGVRQQMDEAEFEARQQEEDPLKPRGEQIPIRRGMLGRLIRYGVPAAAAVGVGYGTARLIGRPLEHWLLSKGVGPKATTFLRYALPIGGALGAGYTLAGRKLMDNLTKAVVGDTTQQQNTGR